MQSPRPLRIAIAKDGETFPHLCAPWTLRTGNLAREMARRGHDVTWFSSTFMHNEKEFYATDETVEEREEGYRMHLLHAGGYQRNISFARWLHHARLAQGIYTRLKRLDLDVVVCCIPILEVAAACALLCRQRAIPLVLDIQDPWPQTFVSYAPARLRTLVRVVLAPYFYGAARLFRQADAIVACSAGFLQWAQRLSRRPEERRALDLVVYHGAHDASGKIAPDPLVATTGLRSIYMGAFAGIYDLDPVATLAESEAARGSDHHFFLVGQGGDRYQRLRDRLAHLPNVTFTGWIPREQAYALAQTCHLGWLPLVEGTEDFLPNKPFEYASLGLAVATSSRGESGRLVTENGLGFCFEPGDPKGLLAEVESLSLASEKLRGWRERCARFSRQSGDARVCSQQFADHIERVVALGRPDRGAP